MNSHPDIEPKEWKKVETLVGQFASGMTCLLGNLVQGWTGLTPLESEEMSRRFAMVTGGAPMRSRTARGRFEGYNYPSDTDDEDEHAQDSGDTSDSDDDPPNNPGGGEREGKRMAIMKMGRWARAMLMRVKVPGMTAGIIMTALATTTTMRQHPTMSLVMNLVAWGAGVNPMLATKVLRMPHTVKLPNTWLGN